MLQEDRSRCRSRRKNLDRGQYRVLANQVHQFHRFQSFGDTAM